jgi:hypothetical protein
VLTGTDDLLPVLQVVGDSGGKKRWERPASILQIIDGVQYAIQRYRPRTEGHFDLIEKWTNISAGDSHWCVISKENVMTLYGADNGSRIFDPEDPDPMNPSRIFSWLISASWDDKGNAILYEYKKENSEGVDLSTACERNRNDTTREVNRHIKRIKYGNRIPRTTQPDLATQDWLFEIVFDYGEHDTDIPVSKGNSPWLCRNDAFSSYQAGFELRSYRLCQRVLMFHHFPNEEGIGRDYLVTSTNSLTSEWET